MTDQKTDQILNAALPVFVRFGFRKTSMSDIARAAGISRAALYLSFSSKEELFRAGSRRAHERTLAEVERVLRSEGGAIQRIELALTAFQRGLITPFEMGTEVEDLFAANMELAGDITLAARTKLLRMLSETLATAVAHSEIDLGSLQTDPTELAGVIIAALEGIKHVNGVGDALEDGTHLLMRLLGTAVSPSRHPID